MQHSKLDAVLTSTCVALTSRCDNPEQVRSTHKFSAVELAGVPEAVDGARAHEHRHVDAAGDEQIQRRQPA